MIVPYLAIPPLGWLLPRHIDWLIACGVPMAAITRPTPIRLAHGFKADDGRFEHDPSGPIWLVFFEPDDLIFWEPRSGSFATWDGRSFALGESIIDNPATFSFNCNLNIFASPFDWLRARRDGIVILDWRRAFDRLRDCPCILIDESLLPTYRLAMRPARMPRLFLRRGQ